MVKPGKQNHLHSCSICHAWLLMKLLATTSLVGAYSENILSCSSTHHWIKNAKLYIWTTQSEGVNHLAIGSWTCKPITQSAFNCSYNIIVTSILLFSFNVIVCRFAQLNSNLFFRDSWCTRNQNWKQYERNIHNCWLSSLDNGPWPSSLS